MIFGELFLEVQRWIQKICMGRDAPRWPPKFPHFWPPQTPYIGVTRPNCVNAACGQALEQGLYSYKRVLALIERIFAQAVNAMDAAGQPGSGVPTAALTQQHVPVREAHEYGDQFAHAVTVSAATAASAQGRRA